MNPRYAAAGLASLGRRGDSTLVHMAPREVAALDRLGAKYGRRVTRNPDTGLPEAFGFLDILPIAAGLITAPFLGPIGAALASGVTAGAKTAAQGGSLGDVAMSAGISGLGSYAGSSILGAGLGAAEGAASLPTAVSESAPTGYITPAIPPASVPESITTPLPELGGSSGYERFPGIMGDQMANPLNIVEPNPAEMQAAATTSASNAPQSFIDRGIAKLGSTWENGIQNIQNIPDKLSAIANYPEEFGQGAFNYIKENPMMGVAAGANLLGMGNYTPPPKPTTSQKPTLRPGFGQSWQQTYNPMPEGYNPGLQGPWDYGFTYSPPIVPGPLNAASGGEVKGMAEGGMASIDSVNLDPLSRLSQNIAHNRNANWGADANWGLTAQNQPSGSLATVISSATQPSLTSGSTLSPGVPTVPGIPGSGVQIGVGQALAPQVGQFDNSTSGTTAEGSSGGDTGEASKAGGVVRDGHIRRYFDGGYIQQNVSGFPADAPGLNMQRNMADGGKVQPSTSTNAATTINQPTNYTPMPEGYNPALQGAWNYNFTQSPSAPVNDPLSELRSKPYYSLLTKFPMWPALQRAAEIKSQQTNGIGASNNIGVNTPAIMPSNPMNYTPMPAGYNPALQGGLDYNFNPMSSGPMNMAHGGRISTRNTVGEAIRALSGEHPDADGALKNFSDIYGPGALAALKNKYGGGRIRGPGGGLDDLVGGTIEGKQEVRLADGEFVVPADVVSGLGGGSTDKGVYELKNMMNRIRKGATGKTTQIKRVNPRKVLPA